MNSITKPCTLALLISLSLTLLFGAAESASAFDVQFKDRVKAEVIRGKNTRIEGGDYDDKIDRVSVTVKLTNGDTKTAFTDLKGYILVFGESQVKRGIYQLTLKESFPVSVAARGQSAHTTEEVQMAWDKTGAVFGYRYSGWLLVVKDSKGKIVLEKATTPRYLKLAKDLSSTSVDNYYTRSMTVYKGNAPR